MTRLSRLFAFSGYGKEVRCYLSARILLPLCLALGGLPAHAITLSLTAPALERTLRQQLFKGPGGRYYLRGNADSACFIYAEEPKVSFRQDRVVVHVKATGRFGTALHGSCLGFGLSAEADVTLLPDTDGQTIGFRDPRIENLSASRELNLFLEPFLSRKLPQQMRVDAMTLLRKALAGSAQSTGYVLSLRSLQISSMQVQDSALVLDAQGELDVE